MGQQGSKKEAKGDEKVDEVKGNKKIASLLSSVPLLSQLTEAERLGLGRSLVSANYKKGDVIIKQGEEGGRFFIIREGEVKVTHETESKAIQEVATLKAGDYFGEAALLNPGTKRGATITALTEVHCFCLEGKDFQALLGDKGKVRFAKRRAVAADFVGKNIKPPAGASKDKNEKIVQFIFSAVKSNALFSSLDDAQKTAVIQEMYKTQIAKGDSPIIQGALGDNVYVVESGTFDVFVDKQKVGELGPGKIFGELALLYNSPRKATVTASSAAVVWVVDRYTYRRILVGLSQQKFKTYLQFLKKVELLVPLAEYEREKIAEALEEVEFKAGATIFNQGEEGDAMYIVWKGEVLISVNEEEVARCSEGQAFGERALLTSEGRAATVTAFSDTICLRLDRTAFVQLLGALEDIMKRQLDAYSSRLSSLSITGRPASASVAVAPSSSDSKTSFTDLKLIGTLGKGAFGHVQLVQDVKTGQTYALKTVAKGVIVETGQQLHIMSEKNAMSRLKHPFIIRLQATYRDTSRLFFLMEPCLGGDLFSVLREKTLFDEDTARFYAACVISAFEYMHDRNIVYRDLKPENLLIDSEGYLKVTDFGFAKDISSGRTWTLCGTPDYLAPEIVEGKGHNKGVDWWTVGVFIYEMLASYAPFYDEDPMKTYEKIVRGELVFPSHFSKEAVSLVKKLLNRKPTKRLGATKGGALAIKQHAWFRGFDWDALLERKLTAPMVPVIKSNVDMSNIDPGDSDSDKSKFPPEVEAYLDDGSNWDADFGENVSSITEK